MNKILLPAGVWTLISAVNCDFQVINANCAIFSGTSVPSAGSAGFIISDGDLRAFTSAGESLYVKPFYHSGQAYAVVKAS